MAVRVIGTRYGAPSLGVLRAVVAEHKRDDPLAPITIVAPTTIAATVARRYLARAVRPRPARIAHGPHPHPSGDTASDGTAGTAAARRPGTASDGTAGTAAARRPGTASAGPAGTAAARRPGTASDGTAGTAAARRPGTASDGTAGSAAARRPGTASDGTAGSAAARRPGTASDGTAGSAAARRPGTASDRPAGTGIAGIYLTTVTRLAEQIAAPAMAARRPATGAVVSAAWRAALDAEPDGVFAAVKDHPATVTALLGAHRELRDLTDDQLAAVAATGRLPAAVVGLHRRVSESLRRSWYDPTDLLRAAAALVADGAVRWDEHGPVVLLLPQDLTNAESALLRGIASATDLTVIAGRTGVERADETVDRTLRRIGIHQEPDKPRPPIAHRIRHASDSDEEVRLVVRDVVAALRDTTADRIAVFHATADPYARLLHEQLDAAGIAVNGPGVEPVGERAIARGFVGLLGLLDGTGPGAGAELPRSALFDALSAAPVRADLGATPTTEGADTGARVPVARWERLSRSAGIVAGDDWTVRLGRLIADRHATIGYEQTQDAPSQGRIDAAERDIAAAADLRRFAGALRARLAAGAALTDWSALSGWALDLFRDLYGTADGDRPMRLPPDELYAAAAVEGVLSGLAALTDVEPTASASALVEVVQQELGASLPRVGRFGDGVFVGPLSAAIGLDLDRTFVVGLAEDSYPGRLHPDPLLSPTARAAAGGALPGERDRLNAAHRHLLAAFASAPRVQASFPRGNLRRSTDRLPSRWLLYTLRYLTGRDDLAATDWRSARSPEILESPSFAAALLRSDATEPLATEQEWRVRAVSAGRRLDDAVIDGGVAMAIARRSPQFTRFDGNLGGAVDLPSFATGERRISPTALESYASCPHGYFVKRMLGVEPIEQPEQTITIAAVDIGNLIHEAMDRLVTEFQGDLPGFGEPWRIEHRDRLADIAGDLAERYETSGATGHPRLWEHERRRIIDDLTAMLADDDSYRRGQDAEVVASELTFGKDGEPPVRVAVPGGTVLMVGSADKVDRTRDGVLLVTDIKTGSAQRYTAIENDPVVGGTRLQLPVYAHAARQQLGAEQVRAQYWFVRKDRYRRIPVDLNDTVEQAYARTLGVLVQGIASGLFPAKAPEVADFAWVQCPYCNPDSLGHADARERWERKRGDPALAELVALIDPGAATEGDADAGATGDSANPTKPLPSVPLPRGPRQ